MRAKHAILHTAKLLILPDECIQSLRFIRTLTCITSSCFKVYLEYFFDTEDQQATFSLRIQQTRGCVLPGYICQRFWWILQNSLTAYNQVCHVTELNSLAVTHPGIYSSAHSLARFQKKNHSYLKEFTNLTWPFPKTLPKYSWRLFLGISNNLMARLLWEHYFLIVLTTSSPCLGRLGGWTSILLSWSRNLE